MDITYRRTKALSPRLVQSLFRRLEWSDWWTQKDIEWYLRRALRVVSAWDGRNLWALDATDQRIHIIEKTCPAN